MFFLRLLNIPGLAKFRDDFMAEYPFDLTASPDDAGADTAGTAWATIWRGRALDGRKLAAALAPLRDATGKLTDIPAGPKVPPGQQKKLIDVLQKWVEWFDDALVETGAADAWNPSRQEYAFATSASVTGGEITLAADEYADGDLDWYAVDAAAQSLGVSAPAPAPVHLRPTLPAPVEYPGKPADRFWEFEDAAVHFGALTAGPTDLSRLLLVEFALIYGNDWFIVPVRLRSDHSSGSRASRCAIRSASSRRSRSLGISMGCRGHCSRSAARVTRLSRLLRATSCSCHRRSSRRWSAIRSRKWRCFATRWRTWRGASSDECRVCPASRTIVMQRPRVGAQAAGVGPAGGGPADLSSRDSGAGTLDPARALSRRREALQGRIR
jgi:hypothetical protein